MRIAVISDVHGNLRALRAVLDRIEVERTDLLVNLGDHLSGALEPAATADLLMATPAVSIRGNHDRRLLEGDPDSMGRSDRLAHDDITDEHRAWLGQQPARAEVVPGVLAFHGVPGDDLTGLLETVTPDGARHATVAEIAERVAEERGIRLHLCGHTHLQRATRLADDVLVVNPGSVGMQAYDADRPHPHVMESGSPHARFAIVDDASGRWEPEWFEVEYDWDAAADTARDHGREDAARVIRTGRV